MNETITEMAYRWVDGFDPKTLWDEANKAFFKPTEDDLREFVSETEQNARQTAEFAQISAFLNAQADPDAAWEAFEAAVSGCLETLIKAVKTAALDWALDCIVDDYRRNGGNGIVEYLADIVWECGDIETAISYLEGRSAFSTFPKLIYRADVEEKAAEWSAEIEAFLEEYREAAGESFVSDEDGPPVKDAVIWYASEMASRLRAFID